MTRMSEIPPELLSEMTPAVRAFVEALCARIHEQDRIIAAQQKRIDELERRLGMNSGNSSLPPSSDGPGQQPVKPTKGKSGKKRGGQFGHPKRTRPLVPTEDCDAVEHHRPTSGIAKGDILLFLLLWPAARSKRGFKAEGRSRFSLPASITEGSAARKAVSHGLEFGFCLHTIDMASPLSGLQNRAIAKQSIRATSNCWLQA